MLSVVIPTRNRPEFLRAAVSSVLAQTYPDLEIVIVDDASDPDTAVLVASIAGVDQRIRLVRNEQPMGASAARNCGIRVCGGDFIAFLDDDDEWYPDTARLTIDHLDSHRDLVGVSAWHLVVPANGSTTTYRGPTVFDWRDLLWCNFIASPFAVLRRELAGRELLFDEGLITCEDWDLFLRCSQLSPMATLPTVLYRYHRHQSARVTLSNQLRVDGYRRFVCKHQSDMSELCRRYHATRSQIMETVGMRQRVQLAAHVLRSSPIRGEHHRAA